MNYCARRFSNRFGSCAFCANTNFFGQLCMNLFQPKVNSLFSTFVQNDTIYAQSSGLGKCGVAVIRVSGEQTKSVLLSLTRRKTLPPPRLAFVSKLWNPTTNVLLDKALVMWFAAPHSFTGEDICEFQVHGGPAVVGAVLNALSTIDGLRPAEAGDYTKRAFLNNKMDLTEVEGLGDLIHAETEAQRRQAIHQMEGSLSTLYSTWSKEILKCTAHMEAFLDFSEDEGLDSNILENLKTILNGVVKAIDSHLSDHRRGEILRNGVRVAIIGQPNVGKSSLLNAIIQRPAAIVSPIAGTTRDVIETRLDIDGFPVLVNDTAGLCESTDIIEQEGIKRAHKIAEQADLLLVMINAEALSKSNDVKFEISGLVSELDIDISQRKNVLVIVNKIDLVDFALTNLGSIIPISCKTMNGFTNFMHAFTKRIKDLCGDASLGELPSVTQQRHRDHLSKCLENLLDSLHYIEKDVVISAEYLRIALSEIGRVSGKIGAEDILDVIFQDFCIGK